MSYQPPPEQPGGPPSGSSSGGSSSEGTPTTNIPPQGGYAPPPSGGYTPPPSGGTPTTNIPPQGEQPGYTPPSTGGYTPPPGGGYTPPPAGGYTPPPPGGYTPPPPGGGYGAPPPPPPPTGGGMGSMGSAGGVDIQDLMQGYMGAVTTPNTAFYESQIPKANVMKLLIGIGIMSLVGAVVAFITAGSAASGFSSLGNMFQGQGLNNFDTRGFTAGSGLAAALLTIVLTPLMFFIGSGIIYGLAKMLGGQGADFMTHSYLLSLSYVPLGVVSSVLSIIPGLGQLVLLVAVLYRQYSQGKSLEASQRMAPGKAQAAAFIPIGIVLLLACLCIVLGTLGLMAALGGAAR